MWKEVQWARKKSRHPNLSRKSLDLVQSRLSLTAVGQEALEYKSQDLRLHGINPKPQIRDCKKEEEDSY